MTEVTITFTIARSLEDRPGTAPGSLGLKGLRVAFLLAIQLGPRFQHTIITYDDAAGVGEVVNPAPTQLEALGTVLAKDAHGALLVGSPSRLRSDV